MIPLPRYRNRPVGVMGLGGSGFAAARALVASGARPVGWDDSAARRAAAEAEGVEIRDLATTDLSALDLIVWSPGIPHLHPVPHPAARRARAAGCRLVSDVALLLEARPQATFVGITGTNGKSTTTALIGHILAAAGRPVEVGGNLGPPALSRAPLGEDGVYVLELSSYQLDLIDTGRFHVALLLNVSPDHLDRHGGMHNYVRAKERLFERQAADDVAIVGSEDMHSRAVADRLRAAGRRVVPNAAPADGLLRDEAGRVLLDLATVPTLPGRHNHQNAAAAFATVRALGVPADVAAAAIAGYPGLPHRQELVATIGGVRYVNDSKATNADSTEKALGSYRHIYWIAGGVPKEGGIAPLAPLFKRVEHAFLIGQAAAQFAETLGETVPHTMSGDLATALAQAHAMAQREGIEGAVVLLSPACASFDQWPNFNARGDAFREMAGALVPASAPGAAAARSPRKEAVAC